MCIQNFHAPDNVNQDFFLILEDTGAIIAFVFLVIYPLYLYFGMRHFMKQRGFIGLGEEPTAAELAHNRNVVAPDPIDEQKVRENLMKELMGELFGDKLKDIEADSSKGSLE